MGRHIRPRLGRRAGFRREFRRFVADVGRQAVYIVKAPRHVSRPDFPRQAVDRVVAEIGRHAQMFVYHPAAVSIRPIGIGHGLKHLGVFRRVDPSQLQTRVKRKLRVHAVGQDLPLSLARQRVFVGRDRGRPPLWSS